MKWLDTTVAGVRGVHLVPKVSGTNPTISAVEHVCNNFLPHHGQRWEHQAIYPMVPVPAINLVTRLDADAWTARGCQRSRPSTVVLEEHPTETQVFWLFQHGSFGFCLVVGELSGTTLGTWRNPPTLGLMGLLENLVDLPERHSTLDPRSLIRRSLGSPSLQVPFIFWDHLTRLPGSTGAGVHRAGRSRRGVLDREKQPGRVNSQMAWGKGQVRPGPGTQIFDLAQS